MRLISICILHISFAYSLVHFLPKQTILCHYYTQTFQNKAKKMENENTHTKKIYGSLLLCLHTLGCATTTKLFSQMLIAQDFYTSFKCHAICTHIITHSTDGIIISSISFLSIFVFNFFILLQIKRVTETTDATATDTKSKVKNLHSIRKYIKPKAFHYCSLAL